MHCSPYRIGVTEDRAHDVQLVLAPKHIWQVALQSRQTPPSSYLPTAHIDVHVPISESRLPPGRQARQPVAVASEQAAHEASHAVHVPLAANVPDGQLVMHCPSWK